MKIAIISDIHNNEVNLQKVLDFCAREKISEIICCGDLASQESLDFLNEKFSGQIYYCFGNMDNDQLRNFENVSEYKNTKIFKKVGEIKFSSPAQGEAGRGWSVAFVHFPEVAKKLATSGKFDFVFYGHTHKPWVENIDQTILLNPGNVAGEIFPPTFAIWDTTKDKEPFKLIRIHDLK